MTISSQRLLDAMLRNDLVAFTQRVFAELNPGSRFEYNWHHDALAYHINAITSGQIDRLLINVPPRSLKSVMVTVALPAFLLGLSSPHRVVRVVS